MSITFLWILCVILFPCSVWWWYLPECIKSDQKGLLRERQNNSLDKGISSNNRQLYSHEEGFLSSNQQQGSAKAENLEITRQWAFKGAPSRKAREKCQHAMGLTQVKLTWHSFWLGLPCSPLPWAVASYFFQQSLHKGTFHCFFHLAWTKDC